MNTQDRFAQLEPALLEEINTHGIIKTFAMGDVIMRTGQYIKSTVLILEGMVKISRNDDEGSEFLMYYLQPGEACAISIICASKAETSQITATAMEDTTVLMIPIGFMDTWMSKYKSWYYFVLETYRSRFEELLVVIDNVAFRNMDERLQFYLKRHTAASQSNIIALSHQQIAEELNSSREVISRLLKKMEQRGMLKLHRNSIELLIS
ncbi:Crp/Fnr family transcriptional regulator [Limnovirga soli]|uniref:Cyclic nucleotide-binding domain-containing protein n=1 Tax=Limnovirga soli TaxID=2656915 RepID=A0A8J8FIX1_9BACT|nr:Crp/Fnr family transcriptional regulator [Limnovirga soli]NNV57179.1 cyclic nucleotide-binding domain-containing protein [Limnovirga soli]